MKNLADSSPSAQNDGGRRSHNGHSYSFGTAQIMSKFRVLDEFLN
jgi:hypothetical protein